jgi:hypothetical protein
MGGDQLLKIGAFIDVVGHDAHCSIVVIPVVGVGRSGPQWPKSYPVQCFVGRHQLPRHSRNRFWDGTIGPSSSLSHKKWRV